MDIRDAFDPKKSLLELSADAPQLWQEVLADLRGRITSDRVASFASLRQNAETTLKNLQGASISNSPNLKKETFEAFKARLTVLAIDQFSDVITGKAGEKISLKDHLLIDKCLLSSCEHGRLLTTKTFDLAWRLIANKGAAVGAIQRSGFWFIPTPEFCDRVAEYAQKRPILEIGCGRGLLTSALHQRGQAILGVDDLSWDLAKKPIASACTLIKNQTAASSLASLKPSVVICAWPPPDNTFEENIFSTPSVQLYLTIVSKHRFASGNWRVYLEQKNFSCTTSEPLNSLLRPLEASQQLFIFRRGQPEGVSLPVVSARDD
jgi:hypothetical protein